MACPFCRNNFQVPALQAPATATVINQIVIAPGDYGDPERERRRLETVPDGLKVPILISGIFDILIGLGYTSLGCPAVIGIPMFILGVFELIHFSKAGGARRRDYAQSAKSLAVCEIIIGLFNVVSFICGIIVISKASAVLSERRKRSGPPEQLEWLN